jgi:hypothetical protein
MSFKDRLINYTLVSTENVIFELDWRVLMHLNLSDVDLNKGK